MAESQNVQPGPDAHQTRTRETDWRRLQPAAPLRGTADGLDTIRHAMSANPWRPVLK